MFNLFIYYLYKIGTATATRVRVSQYMFNNKTNTIYRQDVQVFHLIETSLTLPIFYELPRRNTNSVLFKRCPEQHVEKHGLRKTFYYFLKKTQAFLILLNVCKINNLDFEGTTIVLKCVYLGGAVNKDGKYVHR